MKDSIDEMVTVSAGSGEISSFTSVEITAGFNEAARSFRLSVAAEEGPAATARKLVCGTAVTITANGDLLVTGYVDRYQPQLRRGEAIIHVSGRGKGQDFVDCSADIDGGRFENQTLLQMAQQLDKFGVGVHSTTKLEPIPFYQITPGETVFRLLERLARSQGVTLTGKPDGSIEIAGSSSGSNGALIEGQNIRDISVDHNWANRHSKITVRGQSPIGTGEENQEIEDDEDDVAVDRFRPLILLQDDATDKKRAKRRAGYRRNREAGRSLQAQITVPGWHDDGGQLWSPGALVWCESPFAALAQNMLIERVVFHQQRKHGSTATLDLVDPQAYGAEGSKSNDSDDMWDSGADKAADDDEE